LVSVPAHLAEDLRAAVIKSWGLNLCAKKARWFSDTVAAALVPKNVSGAGVVARALNRDNVSGGPGLSKLASVLCPLDHLGELTEVRLMAAISGAEMIMLNRGIKVALVSGTTAAKKYWPHHFAPPKLSARETHNNRKETNGTHSISR
jgi:alanine-glyoxylate transaminase/serine-glyoxylate transaminase/serine-pyruvate transaminase